MIHRIGYLLLKGIVAALAICYLLFAHKIFAQGVSSSFMLKQIEVAGDTGNVFFLNHDGKIGVYDISSEKLSVASAGSIPAFYNQPMDAFIISPSGKRFAALLLGDSLIRVALYDTTSFLASSNGASQTEFSYVLPRSGGWGIGIFSPDERTFYFSDISSRVLFALDIEKQEKTDIKVEGVIRGLEMDKDGNRLFILTQNPDKVFVFDLIARRLTKNYSVDPKPTRMIYNKKLDRIALTNQGSDQVDIIELKTGDIRHVSTGSLPSGIAYDKESGVVFAASNADGAISIISPDYTVKATIPLGVAAYASYPIDLWYAQETKTLVALNSSARRLYFIDPANAKILKEETVQGWARYVQGKTIGDTAAVFRANANDILLVDTRKQESIYYPLPKGDQQSMQWLSSPQDARIDTATNRIFVGNVGSGDITVIDGNSLKPLQKIHIGASPQRIYLNEKERKLYVSDPPNDLIAIVDISKPDYPVKILPIKGMPRSVLGVPSTNKAYVSLSSAGKLGVIDMSTDTLIKEIPLGKESEHLFPLVSWRNEKKNEIYVANYGSDTISVIDGTNDTLKQRIVVGEKPIWIFYIPELDQIYVAVEGEKKIVVVDPHTYGIVDSLLLSASPYRIFFDEATGFVYVTHRKEKIVTILKKRGEGAEIVKEKAIDFLGALDAIPYNGVIPDTLFFTKNTKNVYFASQILNHLAVTSLERDSEGIMNFSLSVTLEADGNVVRAPFASPSPTAPPSSDFVTWAKVLAGPLVFMVIIVLFLLLRKRKNNMSPPIAPA